MRFYTILFFLVSLLFTACEFSSSGQEDPGDEKDTTTISVVTDRDMNTLANLRSKHDCEIAGSILEGNQMWVREKEILVCILADSTTHDADLGESHRILEVYNTESCERVSREVLPVNVSPDFPYYIAEINYNKTSRLLGIKGFDKIYTYDLDSHKLMPPLQPTFANERFAEDAQSGMIRRLEVWEDCLVGYAQDEGVFVFDLEDIENPKTILPFSEYKKDEAYYSLFLLLSGDKYQAIMPSYNFDSDQFTINPLFTNPVALSTNVPQSALNNRFLVLRESNQDRSALAFDLQARERIELPADIANQNTQAILNWLRNR